MTLYGICKSAYRSVTTKAARDWVFEHTPGFLQPLRTKLIRGLEKTARHDEIYDPSYYAGLIDPTMQSSAEAMAKSIQTDLNPNSVIDLGCGTGVLLQTLKSKGMATFGFEYASAAIETCRSRGLDVQRFDIERDPFPDKHASVAISTEVAEHLPSQCADRFVDLLCHMAPTVVLTAATPGSDAAVHGADHVNEQPNEYWIAKFVARGYQFEQDKSMQWRKDWAAAGVAHCFNHSLMIFRKPQP